MHSFAKIVSSVLIAELILTPCGTPPTAVWAEENCEVKSTYSQERFGFATLA